jgi:hypothetical protein
VQPGVLARGYIKITTPLSLINSPRVTFVSFSIKNASDVSTGFPTDAFADPVFVFFSDAGDFAPPVLLRFGGILWTRSNQIQTPKQGTIRF